MKKAKKQKKRLTKKQAYEFLERRFGNYGNENYKHVYKLCGSLGPLNKKWDEVWDEINTKDRLFMFNYIPNNWKYAERGAYISLTRLLTICMFVEDNCR